MQFQLSEILSILEGLVLLGGFIISIRQLILLREQIRLMGQEMREQVDWQRKKATFDYINVYITQFKDANKQLQKTLGLLKQDGQTINLEMMIEELRDEDTRSEVFHLVSYFENLAVGIEHNYFDEPVAMALLYNVVVSTHMSLKPYLLLRKDETGLPVGSNFEKLATRWREG